MPQIKCDEAQPACARCIEKRFTCPGYVKRFKWSAKYETKFTTVEQRLPNRPKLSGICDDEAGNVRNAVAQNVDIGRQPEKYLAEQEHFSKGPRIRSSEIAAWPALLPSSRYEKSPPAALDVFLSNPVLPVQYFSGHLCKHLCAYDSRYNPFRIATVLQVDSSVLFYSLARYLTAAYLISSLPGDERSSILCSSQNDMIHRLQTEITALTQDSQKKRVEVLTAVIGYGLSSSWDGRNDPGLVHYNAAVALYHASVGERMSQPPAFDSQKFFREALVYYWMGLCFVIDPTKEFLADPPAPPADENQIIVQRNTKMIPHPLTGVSAEAQLLMGKVGLLVHAQRLRRIHFSVTSLDNIHQEYLALQAARSLEEELLSLETPELDAFVDTEDGDTPLADLANMNDVYDLSALVLLYRSFPDLLSARLRPSLALCIRSEPVLNNQLGQQWITALAIHALELLDRNTATSGTRTIEQLCLVIIAGELDLAKNAERPVSEFGGGGGHLSLNTQRDLQSHTDLPWSPSEQCCLSVDSDGCSVASVQGFSVSNNENGTQSALDVGTDGVILEARRKVLRRLESIRNILPYKSLKQAEELVLETWKRSDEGLPDFWMDIMLEKGWRFTMI